MSAKYITVEQHVSAPDADALQIDFTAVLAHLEADGYTIDDDKSYAQFGNPSVVVVRITFEYLSEDLDGYSKGAAKAVYEAIGASGLEAADTTLDNVIDDYVRNEKSYLVLQVGIIVLFTLAALYTYSLYLKGKAGTYGVAGI